MRKEEKPLPAASLYLLLALLGGENHGYALMQLVEEQSDGVFGDRLVHVRGPQGVRTSRRHHRLLGLRATSGDVGSPRVGGLPWTSPEVLARVREAAGKMRS